MQTRFCTNIEQSPGARNNIVSTIVPNRATRDNRIGRCVKSPLKNNAAVADEFVEFIGYINLSLEAAAGSYKLDNVLALLDKPLESPVPGAVPPEAARYLGKGVHDQDEHLVSAELADKVVKILGHLAEPNIAQPLAARGPEALDVLFKNPYIILGVVVCKTDKRAALDGVARFDKRNCALPRQITLARAQQLVQYLREKRAKTY